MTIGFNTACPEQHCTAGELIDERCRKAAFGTSCQCEFSTDGILTRSRLTRRSSAEGTYRAQYSSLVEHLLEQFGHCLRLPLRDTIQRYRNNYRWPTRLRNLRDK